MKSAAIIALALAVFFLNGCESFNTVEYNMQPGDSAMQMVDIKKRAILIKKTQDNIVKVCAEPSPDAMGTLAAQVAAEADIPETVKASFLASVQKGSAYVGMRTHTIQLLRDAMYRTCELHFNGGIDEDQYALMMRRYQRFMIRLLAIEQLTGVVKTPTVILNAESSAEASRALPELVSTMKENNEKIIEIESEVKDLTDEIKKLDDKLKELNAELNPKTDEEKKKLTDERKAELEKEIEQKAAEKDELADKKANLESSIENFKEINKALAGGIEKMKGLVASGSVTGAVYPSCPVSPVTNTQVTTISKAVTDIVGALDDLDDAGILCLLYLQKCSENNRDCTKDALYGICNERLSNLANGGTIKSVKGIGGHQIEEIMRKLKKGPNDVLIQIRPK